MKAFGQICRLTFLLCLLGALSLVPQLMAQSAPAKAPQYPQLPSEIPATFEPATTSFDYVKHDVMIPMRDGVRLHTVLLIPRSATQAPILLTRTPYGANDLAKHADSSHLARTLFGYDNATDVIVAGGYIRVMQDVRGKYGSEGEYVMNRPLRGLLNETPVDHATDTYDTIDWLVKNVPESNGKVGILGISYDGFLALMGLANPHPALKVVVSMNPMVDGWLGDDWFHYGAFRQLYAEDYIYEQEATHDSDEKWWTSHFDMYDEFLVAGSAGEIGRRHGLEQVGFWRKILGHPSYDAYWQEQAVDKLLARQPLKVPVMLVHSLWDQEDIYGAIAVYKAIKPKDTNNDKVFLVLGPWHHGQAIEDGSSQGEIEFDSDTALYFRKQILAHFLARYLLGEPASDIAPVNAFETGTNRWLQLSTWPAGCASGCTVASSRLNLRAGQRLSFAEPMSSDVSFDEYVSDPARPVPFRLRPVDSKFASLGRKWSHWLTDDQREFSGRTDVLAFISDPLTKSIKIAGQPIANLVASTSGTDSDWVIKLIDVYPDEVAAKPSLGGYQLMISADIFRGRYRESFEKPEPLAADEPLLYRFALPTANHIFLPGHRIMVQIQSSWFPLYDRNPQNFVENIFWARPQDYKKAIQRVFHARGRESFIELPVVSGPGY